MLPDNLNPVMGIALFIGPPVLLQAAHHTDAPSFLQMLFARLGHPGPDLHIEVGDLILADPFRLEIAVAGNGKVADRCTFGGQICIGVPYQIALDNDSIRFLNSYKFLNEIKSKTIQFKLFIKFSFKAFFRFQTGKRWECTSEKDIILNH